MRRTCNSRNSVHAGDRDQESHAAELLNAEARLSLIRTVKERFAELSGGGTIEFSTLEALRAGDGKITGQIYGLEVSAADGIIKHKLVTKAIAEVLSNQGIEVFKTANGERFFVKEESSLGDHPERVAMLRKFSGTLPHSTSRFIASSRTPPKGETAWHELYCFNRGEKDPTTATIFCSGTFGNVRQDQAAGATLVESGDEIPLVRFKTN